MSCRRLVGIDLGIASAHAVRVLDEEGNTLAKRKAVPTVESLSVIESTALEGHAGGDAFGGGDRTDRACVVADRSVLHQPWSRRVSGEFDRVGGPASVSCPATPRPMASMRTRWRGSRCSIPQACSRSSFRARIAASLDRRVRAAHRLTRQVALHKTRIKALVRQVMPMSPLPGKITHADLAVLERWADPNMLVRAGRKRIAAVIVKASNNHNGIERADEWLAAANAAIELYAGHPAVAFADVAAEIATEVRLLRAIEHELAAHTTERENAYAKVDPGGLARSLPGISEVGGPTLVAKLGDAARFTHAKQVRAFAGLAPKASETGDTRPQRPATLQGRPVAAAHHVRDRRRHRPQTRPAARAHLLRPDGRAWKEPHRCALRRRRDARRARLDRHETPNALRDPRHRRHTRQPRTSRRDHRRTLDRPRRSPRPPPQQESREGPPSDHNRIASNGATFPKPHRQPVTRHRSTRANKESLDTRSRIGNQIARSGAVMASAERQIWRVTSLAAVAAVAACRCRRGRCW